MFCAMTTLLCFPNIEDLKQYPAWIPGLQECCVHVEVTMTRPAIPRAICTRLKLFSHLLFQSNFDSLHLDRLNQPITPEQKIKIVGDCVMTVSHNERARPAHMWQ